MVTGGGKKIGIVLLSACCYVLLLHVAMFLHDADGDVETQHLSALTKELNVDQLEKLAHSLADAAKAARDKADLPSKVIPNTNPRGLQVPPKHLWRKMRTTNRRSTAFGA